MYVQLIFNEPYLNFLCTMMHFQIIFVTYIYQYVSIQFNHHFKSSFFTTLIWLIYIWLVLLLILLLMKTYILEVWWWQTICQKLTLLILPSDGFLVFNPQIYFHPPLSKTLLSLSRMSLMNTKPIYSSNSV